MKRYTIAFLVLILGTFQLLAEKITGYIVDNNNSPIPGASIVIKGTSLGATSNIEGKFVLESLSKENYTLEISFIGFKTKQINTAAPATIKSIVLYEGNELLQEVVITADRVNKFSRKKTAYVAKMPLKSIENSQVYSTITNDLLISQATTSFGDAMKNAVGTQSLWEATGRSGDGAGFYTFRGFYVQPRLVNGLVSITNGGINPSSIERIEVVKGPSATLFGNVVSSYGGLINVVTKKPYQGYGGSASFTAGSFDFYKATLDFNTPLALNENIVFRMNTGLHTQNSWQDAGFKKSIFASPALSYKVNSRLTINLNYEIYSTKQTNPVALFINRGQASTFKNLKELNYDYNKSLTNNDVYLNNPSQNFRGEIRYKLSDNWESQTLVSGSHTSSKGYYSYLYGAQKDLFGLYVQKTDAETRAIDFQQNFSGDFKIGGLRNRFLVGADFFMDNTQDRSTNHVGIHVVNPRGQVIPVPANYGFPNLPINARNLKEVLSKQAKADTEVRYNVLGIYASDVINLSPKLSILAAVRYDRYDYKGDENTSKDDDAEYSKSTFSPKFGIVYQPIVDKLSLFANYQNGFSYVKPELSPEDKTKPNSKRTLKSFDLEKANQIEMGIKTSLFHNKLETTVSFYRIKVKDKVMGYGFYKMQDGEVLSKGVEFECNANPFKGLNLRAGFAYNDSEILETKHEDSKELVGRRQAEAGASTTYNLWADYKFQSQFLRNFGLGFGFNGTSDYNTMIQYPKSGGFTIPGETIFDATAYYENNKFRLGLKVNNLADKEYFKGWSTISPQSPRTFLGTLTYKF